MSAINVNDDLFRTYADKRYHYLNISPIEMLLEYMYKRVEEIVDFKIRPAMVDKETIKKINKENIFGNFHTSLQKKNK